jgi:hypothetical protein
MQHEVGTILYSSWGYDQTNIDWYQVTAKNGTTMNSIRKIASKEVPSPDNFMVGTCTPIRDEFIGPPLRVKPSREGWVGLTSYSMAGPWDGTPKRWSSYA